MNARTTHVAQYFGASKQLLIKWSTKPIGFNGLQSLLDLVSPASRDIQGLPVCATDEGVEKDMRHIPRLIARDAPGVVLSDYPCRHLRS